MDSSRGCDTSLASKDGHRTTLQPHEFVSNNNPDGNILVNKPPDLSKFEYLIDFLSVFNDINKC